jgi:hypothetical protein
MILIDNAYSCVGTYSVKKKDIYFITPQHMEEVIVHPNSARLEKYDFLSWAEETAAKQLTAANGYSYEILLDEKDFDQKVFTTFDPNTG